MNKEEKSLLEAKLYLKYYKKDITDRYDIILDRLVLDNDILNSYEYLWVTPLSKHQKLQQENKQLKDNWNMLKEHLKNRYDNGTESISYRQVFMEIREAMQVLEIAQELEKGDSNE